MKQRVRSGLTVVWFVGAGMMAWLAGVALWSLLTEPDLIVLIIVVLLTLGALMFARKGMRG